MALESRFGFPNFILTGTADTATHEVERGTIDEDGTTFLLEMIRSRKMPNGSFLIGNIRNPNGGKTLWTFPKDDFNGIGLLAPTTHGSVIALVGPGRDGKIERIIPLSLLTGSGQQIGLRKQIRMKDQAGKFLGRWALSTPAEERLIASDVIRAKAEADARIAERAEETRLAAEAKQKQREERRRVILSRNEVRGFTADGKSRRGLPVLESEWQTLPDDDSAIIVESIGEDGTLGNFVEWFKVEREPGKNPRKAFRTPVTAEKPLVTSSDEKTIPKHVGRAWIEMKDEEGEMDRFKVLVYASMDNIREAKKAGLNGGTLVSPANQQDEKGIMVYRIGETIETVGKLSPV